MSNQEICLQCELAADAMRVTYFMTWDTVRVNSGSDNTGEGALDDNKAFQNKKPGDRIENSPNWLTFETEGTITWFMPDNQVLELKL